MRKGRRDLRSCVETKAPGEGAGGGMPCGVRFVYLFSQKNRIALGQKGLHAFAIIL